MILSALSSTQRTAPQEYTDTEKVRTLIAKYLGVDTQRVADGVYLRDLGADWLDRLELMILIEDEFTDVEIVTNDAADQIELVGDLIHHVKIGKAKTATSGNS